MAAAVANQSVMFMIATFNSSAYTCGNTFLGRHKLSEKEQQWKSQQEDVCLVHTLPRIEG